MRYIFPWIFFRFGTSFVLQQSVTGKVQTIIDSP